MNCKIELNKDICDLFSWYSKSDYDNITDKPIELCALSMYGTVDINFTDKSDFFYECNKMIKKYLYNTFTKFGYKLYLFVVIDVENPKSKVTEYKKVWRKLSQEWNFSGFELGPETLINVGDKYFYAGVASFGFNQLFQALNMQHTNRMKSFIFASCRSNLLSEDMVKLLFNDSFWQVDRSNTFVYPHGTIDYNKLFSYCYINKDMIFRVGDSGEDVEVDIVFDSEIYNILSENIKIEETNSKN